MFRVINEYLNKVNICDNEDIYNLLTDFLDNCDMIEKYSIKVDFKRYTVNIKLKDFNVENYVICFDRFSNAVSYPYSEMHVRFNEGKCIRYRYITSKENKDAFYCDIIIN